jgi:hypothetical protein
MTVTNWTTSFVAALLTLKRRNVIITLFTSFGMVSALVSVESAVFKFSTNQNEGLLFRGISGDYPSIKNVFEFHQRFAILSIGSIVMRSDVDQVPALGSYGRSLRLSFQEIKIDQINSITLMTAIFWFVLWMGGFYVGLKKAWQGNKQDSLFVLSLIVQFLMLGLYGVETFLYIALVLPWMVIIAGNAEVFLGPKRLSALLGIVVALNIVNSIVCFPKVEKALQEVYQFRREQYAHVLAGEADPKVEALKSK